MTHPPQSKAQTPTANGLPPAAPEPSAGAEGKDVPRDAPVTPAAQPTTMPDTPVTTTT
ncbi:MAG TPA: hypothetical protein VFN10_03390 [Thermoanaerobaculia bacterium]|nr:hypothetical protein [Thermoanaerobaculia bacterium]